MLWGIDLGGTKIEGVVLDETSNAKELCRLRIETEAEKGYQHILSRVLKLVTLMENETGKTPTAIGVGHPGATRPKEGTLKNSNTLCLNDQPLISDLARKLTVKIFGANDANCFTLAEAQFGAAKKYSTVFGVIMGTGVGGGIVFNKKVHIGAQGIGGEWGHNVVEKSGPECYCGKNGCVEKMICGPALEAYYLSLTNEGINLTEIARRWREGESAALKVKERLISFFGQSLSQVINIIDPDAIILGGGLSNIAELYTEGPAEVAKYVFNDKLETPILKNSLGDSAGVFGAALLTKGISA